MNSGSTRVTTTLILAFTLVMGAFVAQAQWVSAPTNIFTFNFNNDPYGSYSGTNLPSGPYIYSYADGDNTTFDVGDRPGMSKAVIISNSATLSWSLLGNDNQGGLDHYSNDTDPTVFGGHGVYSFDINQIVNSLDIGPKVVSDYHDLGGSFTNVNAGWETQVFGYISGYGTIWRFAVVATNEAGGNIMLQLPDLSLTTVATFTTGTVYHVVIDNNYLTDTYDVTIDGTSVAFQMPFKVVAPTNSQLKEFLAYNWVAGTGDQNITAFDNFNYYLEVPEPSPTFLAAISLIIFGVISRRARRTV